jgi:hypothetical protein
MNALDLLLMFTVNLAGSLIGCLIYFSASYYWERWYNDKECRMVTSAPTTDVEIIYICDLIDALGIGDMEYMATGPVIMKWCAGNDATYYSATREDFSLIDAAAQAVREGKSKVVVEDLS